MKPYLTLIFTLLSVSAIAQKSTHTPNTTIQLSLSHFQMPNMYFTPLYNPKIGVDVIRKVSAHFDVQFSLSSMVNIGGGGENSYQFKLDLSRDPTGQIKARREYRYIDVAARYHESYKKHMLFLGAGITYVHGRDIYIKSFYMSPGYGDALMDIKGRYHNYYGINMIAGYSYQLSKRINVGLSGKGYLLSKGLKEYNASINIGYSFNAFR